MKIKLLLLVLLISNSLFAQKKKFIGKVEYNMLLNFDRPIEYRSKLLFNNTFSIFTYKEIPSSTDEELLVQSENFDNTNIDIILNDTITKQITIDKIKDSLYEKHISLVNKKMYYTMEKNPDFKWIITEDKKNIKNIECNLAKTSFRGRNYFVWYAPSIANSYGPWKLNGLPGMILEAYDDRKEVFFSLNSIKTPIIAEQKILNKELPIISLNEHKKKNLSLNNELENKIKSKFGRGINIKIETKVNSIELNCEN